MRRRFGLVVAAAVVSTGLVPLAVSAQAESGQGQERGERAPTTITVSPDRIAKPVSREMVGGNHRWLWNGLEMWDAENDRPWPRIVELAKRTGLGVVRYPGGTVANLFEWKKAVDDPDKPGQKRGCQVAAGFVGKPGQPVDSAYGPDENERFVDEVGARTTIMTNGSGQPASDAADYVEYMNAEAGVNKNGGKDWAKVRDRNKQAAGLDPGPYGVDVWEIANEPDLGNQHYWRSPNPETGLRQYAFGGTQKQHDQPLARNCDHRDSAARSSGAPDQELQVRYPPIAPETRVTVQVGDSPDVWTRVDDLGAAGPGEKVFELDRKTGEIRFGTGRDGAGNGKIPYKGAGIRATYASGPHPGFVDYHDAMKQVDSSISICSSWDEPEFVELMGSEHSYDCIGPHLYTHPVWDDKATTMHDDALSQVNRELEELDALESAIDEFGPGGDSRPFLEVSEYGQIPKGEKGKDSPQNWGGSISTTTQFGSYAIGMIKRDVQLAVASNLNARGKTAGQLFGGSAHFVDTARAQALAMVGEMAGTQPILNRTDGNPIADGGYVALRALATEADDGTVRLFVVNRARGLNIQTRVDLPDSVPASGELTMRTLNGDRLESANTPEDPDAVRVASAKHDWSDGGFDHRFPAHSITMIEIPG